MKWNAWQMNRDASGTEIVEKVIVIRRKKRTLNKKKKCFLDTFFSPFYFFFSSIKSTSFLLQMRVCVCVCDKKLIDEFDDHVRKQKPTFISYEFAIIFSGWHFIFVDMLAQGILFGRILSIEICERNKKKCLPHKMPFISILHIFNYYLWIPHKN